MASAKRRMDGKTIEGALDAERSDHIRKVTKGDHIPPKRRDMLTKGTHITKLAFI
jgi:hypothetical protein